MSGLASDYDGKPRIVTFKEKTINIHDFSKIFMPISNELTRKAWIWVSFLIGSWYHAEKREIEKKYNEFHVLCIHMSILIHNEE